MWFLQALPGDNDSILCFFLKVSGAGDTEGEGWGDHGGCPGWALSTEERPSLSSPPDTEWASPPANRKPGSP